MFLVDSHCHFNLLDLGNDTIDNVIERAKAADVKYFLNVCVDLKNFPEVLKTSERYAFVSTSVGLHPNEQNEAIDLAGLIKLARHPKVVAIGETGLDYFRTEKAMDWQLDRFRIHIAAAKTLSMPLIIHTRNAKEDTLRLMKEENASEAGGVMHCFTEDWETARQALDMGFYISFSGIVTFKSAQALQDVAKKVPLDRMLIETDSPYLAPNPYRGKPNEPAYVRYTADYLAELRQIPLELLAEATTENFFHLFRGAVKPNV